MQKQAPSLGRLLVMAGFALSCFGLLLFLWLAFGGPIPLKPKGYRFNVAFKEAGTLANEADVRISGVSVGKVKVINADKETGASDATIELDDRVRADPEGHEGDPAPEDAAGRDLRRADAGRQERRDDPRGRPPARRRRSSPTVELDEIFRAFDPKTRAAFQTGCSSRRWRPRAAGATSTTRWATWRRSPRTPRRC